MTSTAGELEPNSPHQVSIPTPATSIFLQQNYQLTPATTNGLTYSRRRTTSAPHRPKRQLVASQEVANRIDLTAVAFQPKSFWEAKRRQQFENDAFLTEEERAKVLAALDASAARRMALEVDEGDGDVDEGGEGASDGEDGSDEQQQQERPVSNYLVSQAVETTAAADATTFHHQPPPEKGNDGSVAATDNDRICTLPAPQSDAGAVALPQTANSSSEVSVSSSKGVQEANIVSLLPSTDLAKPKEGQRRRKGKKSETDGDQTTSTTDTPLPSPTITPADTHAEKPKPKRSEGSARKESATKGPAEAVGTTKEGKEIAKGSEKKDRLSVSSSAAAPSKSKDTKAPSDSTLDKESGKKKKGSRKNEGGETTGSPATTPSTSIGQTVPEMKPIAGMSITYAAAAASPKPANTGNSGLVSSTTGIGPKPIATAPLMSPPPFNGNSQGVSPLPPPRPPLVSKFPPNPAADANATLWRSILETEVNSTPEPILQWILRTSWAPAAVLPTHIKNYIRQQLILQHAPQSAAAQAALASGITALPNVLPSSTTQEADHRPLIGSASTSLSTAPHQTAATAASSGGGGGATGSRLRHLQPPSLHQQVLALLNKVSDDEAKFTKVAEAMKALPLPSASDEVLDKVVDCFFRKAVLEQRFCPLYARMVWELCQHETAEGGGPDEPTLNGVNSTTNATLSEQKTESAAAKTESEAPATHPPPPSCIGMTPERQPLTSSNAIDARTSPTATAADGSVSDHKALLRAFRGRLRVAIVNKCQREFSNEEAIHNLALLEEQLRDVEHRAAMQDNSKNIDSAATPNTKAKKSVDKDGEEDEEEQEDSLTVEKRRILEEYLKAKSILLGTIRFVGCLYNFNIISTWVITSVILQLFFNQPSMEALEVMENSCGVDYSDPYASVDLQNQHQQYEHERIVMMSTGGLYPPPPEAYNHLPPPPPLIFTPYSGLYAYNEPSRYRIDQLAMLLKTCLPHYIESSKETADASELLPRLAYGCFYYARHHSDVRCGYTMRDILDRLAKESSDELDRYDQYVASQLQPPKNAHAQFGALANRGGEEEDIETREKAEMTTRDTATTDHPPLYLEGLRLSLDAIRDLRTQELIEIEREHLHQMGEGIVDPNDLNNMMYHPQQAPPLMGFASADHDLEASWRSPPSDQNRYMYSHTAHLGASHGDHGFNGSQAPTPARTLQMGGFDGVGSPASVDSTRGSTPLPTGMRSGTPPPYGPMGSSTAPQQLFGSASNQQAALTSEADRPMLPKTTSAMTSTTKIPSPSSAINKHTPQVSTSWLRVLPSLPDPTPMIFLTVQGFIRRLSASLSTKVMGVASSTKSRQSSMAITSPVDSNSKGTAFLIGNNTDSVLATDPLEAAEITAMANATYDEVFADLCKSTGAVTEPAVLTLVVYWFRELLTVPNKYRQERAQFEGLLRAVMRWKNRMLLDESKGSLLNMSSESNNQSTHPTAPSSPAFGSGSGTESGLGSPPGDHQVTEDQRKHLIRLLTFVATLRALILDVLLLESERMELMVPATQERTIGDASVMVSPLWRRWCEIVDSSPPLSFAAHSFTLQCAQSTGTTFGYLGHLGNFLSKTNTISTKSPEINNSILFADGNAAAIASSIGVLGPSMHNSALHMLLTAHLSPDHFLESSQGSRVPLSVVSPSTTSPASISATALTPRDILLNQVPANRLQLIRRFIAYVGDARRLPPVDHRELLEVVGDARFRPVTVLTRFENEWLTTLSNNTKFASPSSSAASLSMPITGGAAAPNSLAVVILDDPSMGGDAEIATFVALATSAVSPSARLQHFHNNHQTLSPPLNSQQTPGSPSQPWPAPTSAMLEKSVDRLFHSRLRTNTELGRHTFAAKVLCGGMHAEALLRLPLLGLLRKVIGALVDGVDRAEREAWLLVEEYMFAREMLRQTTRNGTHTAGVATERAAMLGNLITFGQYYGEGCLVAPINGEGDSSPKSRSAGNAAAYELEPTDTFDSPTSPSSACDNILRKGTQLTKMLKESHAITEATIARVSRLYQQLTMCASHLLLPSYRPPTFSAPAISGATSTTVPVVSPSSASQSSPPLVAPSPLTAATTVDDSVTEAVELRELTSYLDTATRTPLIFACPLATLMATSYSPNMISNSSKSINSVTLPAHDSGMTLVGDAGGFHPDSPPMGSTVAVRGSHHVGQSFGRGQIQQATPLAPTSVFTSTIAIDAPNSGSTNRSLTNEQLPTSQGSDLKADERRLSSTHNSTAGSNAPEIGVAAPAESRGKKITSAASTAPPPPAGQAVNVKRPSVVAPASVEVSTSKAALGQANPVAKVAPTTPLSNLSNSGVNPNAQPFSLVNSAKNSPQRGNSTSYIGGASVLGNSSLPPPPPSGVAAPRGNTPLSTTPLSGSSLPPATPPMPHLQQQLLPFATTGGVGASGPYSSANGGGGGNFGGQLNTSSSFVGGNSSGSNHGYQHTPQPMGGYQTQGGRAGYQQHMSSSLGSSGYQHQPGMGAGGVPPPPPHIPRNHPANPSHTTASPSSIPYSSAYHQHAPSQSVGYGSANNHPGSGMGPNDFSYNAPRGGGGGLGYAQSQQPPPSHQPMAATGNGNQPYSSNFHPPSGQQGPYSSGQGSYMNGGGGYSSASGNMYPHQQQQGGMGGSGGGYSSGNKGMWEGGVGGHPPHSANQYPPNFHGMNYNANSKGTSLFGPATPVHPISTGATPPPPPQPQQRENSTSSKGPPIPLAPHAVQQRQDSAGMSLNNTGYSQLATSGGSSVPSSPSSVAGDSPRSSSVLHVEAPKPEVVSVTAPKSVPVPSTTAAKGKAEGKRPAPAPEREAEAAAPSRGSKGGSHEESSSHKEKETGGNGRERGRNGRSNAADDGSTASGAKGGRRGRASEIASNEERDGHGSKREADRDRDGRGDREGRGGDGRERQSTNRRGKRESGKEKEKEPPLPKVPNFKLMPSLPSSGPDMSVSSAAGSPPISGGAFDHHHNISSVSEAGGADNINNGSSSSQPYLTLAERLRSAPPKPPQTSSVVTVTVGGVPTGSPKGAPPTPTKGEERESTGGGRRQGDRGDHGDGERRRDGRDREGGGRDRGERNNTANNSNSNTSGGRRNNNGQRGEQRR